MTLPCWEGLQFPLTRQELLTRPRIKARRESPRRWRSPVALLPGKELGFKLSTNGRRPAAVSANMRLLRKTNKGWSWLSIKFREELPNNSCSSPTRPQERTSTGRYREGRKGDLPPELVKSIWGDNEIPKRFKLPSYPSPKKHPKDIAVREVPFLDVDSEIRKINSRKRERVLNEKAPETLMDVLLQNWTCFDHVYGHVTPLQKQVHAKYCENEFGEFIFPGGQQIHCRFNVPVKFLVAALRNVTHNLRAKIHHAQYQELPAWKSPRQEEPASLELPPVPSLPQLYPIQGLLSIPSEQEVAIPNDLKPPVFKPPMPKQHPPLLLPEPLKVPPLTLPAMLEIRDAESSINYDDYKDIPPPIYVAPEMVPLPEWVEPSLLELPLEPQYLTPQIFPLPVLENVQTFKVPWLDPRPCEKSYYECEVGVCDGLCSKHGSKHHYIPGHRRREPCFAKPQALIPIPEPPFPEAKQVALALSSGNWERLAEELMQGRSNEQIIHTHMLAEQDSSDEVNDEDDISSHVHPIFRILYAEPEFQAPQEEHVPVYQPPMLKPEPVYRPCSPPQIPLFKEPPSPGPIGWLGGQRPLFLIDCGGTMAGDRIAAVQSCFKVLFGAGGQVEIAATHFDIIMYSFDAWSYGAIENTNISKQAAAGSRNYVKVSSEPMRIKTQPNLDAALEWLLKWRPAGTTNLWKAINLAINRTLPDCIYIFSDGKPDKPVLILDSLKKLARMRGYSTPIHTIGLRASKPGCRFLQRLSAATGGQFMELDLEWDQRPASFQEEEAWQMGGWARATAEGFQRMNAVAGTHQDMNMIMERRVAPRFQVEWVQPVLRSHTAQEEDLLKQHDKQLQNIQMENRWTLLKSKLAHEQLSHEIQERNKANLKNAKANWRAQVERVRCLWVTMSEALVTWQQSMRTIEQQNELSVRQARERYAQDLQKVEEKNNAALENAKREYQVEVERVNQRNERVLAEVVRRQQEEDENINELNKSKRAKYDADVAAIEASNLITRMTAQLAYEEEVAKVNAENTRRTTEADSAYAAGFKEVREENERRKRALAERLEDIKLRREIAIRAHQAAVASAIEAHEQEMKAVTMANQGNEEVARAAWRVACEEVDRQNEVDLQVAKQELEVVLTRVHEANLQLAQRRLDFRKQVEDVERCNQEVVRRAKVAWKEASARAEQEYEASMARAREAHTIMTERIKASNAERLQGALLEHKAMVAATESYNETIRPYVEASIAVRTEIARIEAFLTCLARRLVSSPPPPPNATKDNNNNTTNIINNKNGLLSEKDLEVLSSSEAPLNTAVLIDALQMAYGKSWKYKADHEVKITAGFNRSGSPSSSSSQSSICESNRIVQAQAHSIIPIHPPRASAHQCTATLPRVPIAVT